MKKWKFDKDTINFLVFWFGQAVSGLGSSMTGFALTIWAYQQTGKAMTVSLMTFCSYLPRILVSTVAGSFVDRHSKKRIMLAADSVAALCSLIVFYCALQGSLTVSLIYLVNLVIGLMNAFQHPAASVVTGMLVPDGAYDRASGLNSFSGNLITVTAPMLAGVLMASAGLHAILLTDLLTFLFAAGTLMFFVTVKEPKLGQNEEKSGVFCGFLEGLNFLKQNTGLLHMMLFMALINFLSRLTYENILSPMILARSGSSMAYGTVSGVLGAGGIVGGIFVTLGKKKRDPVKMIYLAAACSFCFGDLLLGAGRSLPMWCMGGIGASVFIPYIIAGQNMILYRTVPQKMQGRIFAVQSIVQYSSIPVGILLGGILADHVMEPFMASGNPLALLLGRIVGNGSGSGMAVMFLCTGILGTASSIWGYHDKELRKLADGMSVPEKNKKNI